MSVKNFRVEYCTIQDIREFIETHHYSGTVNGLRISHCFALYDSSTLIGAMIYGSLGMANAYKKYAENGCEIVVVNQESLSPQQEMVEDLLSIVHTFSCRLHGMRKYKKQIKEDYPNSKEPKELLT